MNGIWGLAVKHCPYHTTGSWEVEVPCPPGSSFGEKHLVHMQVMCTVSLSISCINGVKSIRVCSSVHGLAKSLYQLDLVVMCPSKWKQKHTRPNANFVSTPRMSEGFMRRTNKIVCGSTTCLKGCGVVVGVCRRGRAGLPAGRVRIARASTECPAEVGAGTSAGGTVRRRGRSPHNSGTH
jgi:hypothetical protein